MIQFTLQSKRAMRRPNLLKMNSNRETTVSASTTYGAAITSGIASTRRSSSSSSSSSSSGAARPNASDGDASTKVTMETLRQAR